MVYLWALRLDVELPMAAHVAMIESGVYARDRSSPRSSSALDRFSSFIQKDYSKGWTLTLAV